MATNCLHQPSTHKRRTKLLNNREGILGSGLGLPEIPPLFAWYHSPSRDRPSTTPLLDQQKSSTQRTAHVGIGTTRIQIYPNVEQRHCKYSCGFLIPNWASSLPTQYAKGRAPYYPQQIAELQQPDPTIKEIILQIRGRKNHIHRNFIIINNILHFVSQVQTPRVYVPEALHPSYLEFYHNSQLTGRIGFYKLLHRIRSLYYWPKLPQSISQFLKACPTCQSMKAPQQSYGTLHPIEVIEPFELVGWDLMGPFPTSIHGNKYILVITEYLTRWCEAIVLSDAMVSSVAHALLQRVIFPHGCPRQLLSNQGSQFRSEVIRILSHSLGITQIFTSLYHPQSNRLTEHLNWTIKQVISAYVDPLHQSWDQVLPFVVHAYNTSVQESTRISPFRALYGRNPRLPPDIHVIKAQPRRTDATEWWLHLQTHQPLLRCAIQHNVCMAQQR